MLAGAQDAAPSAADPDRILGAWLGRSAGCLLGKPVEKIPPEGIRAILEAEGRWPLTSYFTAEGLDPAVAAKWPWNRASGGTSLAENIDGMPEDDDLNYTILGLQLLEAHGREFSTDDVALSWLMSLPAGRVFTAERAAYRNLLEGVEPERCATRWNPFREWIGALIRTDVYGWVSPGDPAAAARLAHEDARLSHTRNGIYGAMWAAALGAAAVVSDDIDAVLASALSVVPPRSRLADAIRFGDELGASGKSLDASLMALWTEFDGVHWVHVLNNAATIAWALRRGGGRFDDSVPLAVMAGWDTDSAGATVGAVCGALAGANGLAERWTAPLKNRITTSLPGLSGIALSELAARTSAAAAWNGK
jgi:ADP-ribosylglycohydrolase